jgi:hypothetical protein
VLEMIGHPEVARMGIAPVLGDYRNLVFIFTFMLVTEMEPARYAYVGPLVES